MAVRELLVEGYRSIRRLRLALAPLTIVVGPNGSGKTNLYRSMVLLGAAASGRLARTLADEGGMPSALWAGDRGAGRKRAPVRMTLGVTVLPLTYRLSLGLPSSTMWEAGDKPSRFLLDPLVKEERVLFDDGKGPVTLAERKAPSAMLRDADGGRVTYPQLRTAEAVLSQLQDPHRFPTLSMLREEFLAWRFYHHFRTDPEAPMRRPQVGIQTPVLAPDGADLAAALQTIREIGAGEDLDEAIGRAFPGSTLLIDSPDARFEVLLEMPGIRRPLRAAELSDGTLRYLCLLAALLSPRPPALLALNEPETSLHPELLDPLAALLAQAARRTQLWVTTHSERLASQVAAAARIEPVRLEKVSGETRVQGQSLLEREAGDEGADD